MPTEDRQHPWPLECNPRPGVEGEFKATIALAYRVLECLARGELQDGILMRRTQALLAGLAPVSESEGLRLIYAWGEAGHAQRCLRDGIGRTGERGYLDEDGVAQLLSLAARWERARGEPTDVEREAFRLLLRAGAEPVAAWKGVRAWNPWSGELISGQWIPEEHMPRTPNGAVLVAGERIAPEPFMRARRVLWDDPSRATQMIMHACGITAARAAKVVRALGSGWAVDAELAAPLAEAERVTAPASSAKERVQRGIRLLLADFPLHWAVLAQATLRASEAHETMWVSALGEGGAPIALSYHPGFVDKLTDLECAAVLQHEVHHLIFDHLDGPPPPSRGELTERHHACWKLAAECNANEFIEWPLPYEPIRIEGLGLPPGESTVQRYQRLVRRGKSLAGTLRALAAGELRPCGRAHGAGIPQRHDERRSVLAAIRAAIEKVGEGLDQKTRAALAGTSAGRQLEELARGEKARLSWQQLLRVRVRSMSARTSTRTFPSRRAPELIGVVPGRRARRTHPVVMVAIDTSGSMSLRDLSQIAAEVEALLRLQARVAVVQCDVEIERHGWFRKGDTIDRVYGRGGTDLQPPFERAMLQRYRPDLIVYFTDGQGPAPSAAPKGVEVLWVLTGAWAEVPAPWGRVVRM